MQNKSDYKQIKIIVITGPTASGKTKFASNIAEKINAEIISADSRQVYRGMDIGTGKDLADYGNIKYHLIDIIEPSEQYNLARFRNDAAQAIQKINDKGKIPIICGGTPLYIDCLLSQYKLNTEAPDEQLRQKLSSLSCEQLLQMLGENLPSDEAKNKTRLIRRIEKKLKHENQPLPPLPFEPQWLVLGLLWQRSEIHSRIETRLKKRLGEGMIEEVKLLHQNGISWQRLEQFGLEYKYIALHLQNKLTYDQMFNSLLAKIRTFARKQDAWFRKIEKKGIPIYWIKNADLNEAESLIDKFLKNEPLPPPQIKLSEIFYNK